MDNNRRAEMQLGINIITDKYGVRPSKDEEQGRIRLKMDINGGTYNYILQTEVQKFNQRYRHEGTPFLFDKAKEYSSTFAAVYPDIHLETFMDGDKGVINLIQQTELQRFNDIRNELPKLVDIFLQIADKAVEDIYRTCAADEPTSAPAPAPEKRPTKEISIPSFLMSGGYGEEDPQPEPVQEASPQIHNDEDFLDEADSDESSADGFMDAASLYEEFIASQTAKPVVLEAQSAPVISAPEPVMKEISKEIPTDIKKDAPQETPVAEKPVVPSFAFQMPSSLKAVKDLLDKAEANTSIKKDPDSSDSVPADSPTMETAPSSDSFYGEELKAYVNDKERTSYKNANGRITVFYWKDNKKCYLIKPNDSEEAEFKVSRYLNGASLVKNPETVAPPKNCVFTQRSDDKQFVMLIFKGRLLTMDDFLKREEEMFRWIDSLFGNSSNVIPFPEQATSPVSVPETIKNAKPVPPSDTQQAMKRIREEAAELYRQANAKNEEAKERERSVILREAELTTKQAQVDAAALNIEKLQKECQTRAEALTSLEADIRKRQEDLKSKEAELIVKETGFAGTQRKLEAGKILLEEDRKKFEALKAAWEKQYQSEKTESINLNTFISNAKAELEDLNGLLAARNAALGLENVESQLAEKDAQISRLKAELSEAEAQNAAFQANLDTMNDSFKTAFEQVEAEVTKNLKDAAEAVHKAEHDRDLFKKCAEDAEAKLRANVDRETILYNPSETERLKRERDDAKKLANQYYAALRNAEDRTEVLEVEVGRLTKELSDKDSAPSAVISNAGQYLPASDFVAYLETLGKEIIGLEELHAMDGSIVVFSYKKATCHVTFRDSAHCIDATKGIRSLNKKTLAAIANKNSGGPKVCYFPTEEGITARCGWMTTDPEELLHMVESLVEDVQAVL